MWKIIFIAIIMLFSVNATVQGSETNELIHLTDFFQEADVEIGEWQVMMKEQKSRIDIELILEELKDSYKVTRTEDESIIKYQFRDAYKENNLSVLYNVVLPKNNLNYPELIVVFQGDNWSKEVEKVYLSEQQSIRMEFFTDSGKTFTWLKAASSDIMVEGEFKQKLTKFFDLQHIDTHFDNTSNSVSNKFIYGYTSFINENIIIESTPVNVQVAITKNEKGTTELTLGTPILVHEY